MSGNIPRRRPDIITLRIYLKTLSRSIVAALPALAGALVLAGCGGGNTAAGASGSATAAGQSAFQSCLRQHGVTAAAGPSGRPTGSFPTGSFPADAIPSGSFPGGSPRPGASFPSGNSAAFQACAKYAPSGTAGAPGQAVSSSSLTAFKTCMSSHGVKVTGSTASAILAQFRNSTGKTATAFHTCQVLIQPAASSTPTPSP